MPKPETIAAARERALAFIERRQEPDGSFVSYSSARMQPFRRVRSWQTTFVPALMLAALAGSNDAGARTIRRRLATFLLAQKGRDGAFNYWAKTAPEYRSMAYPADLDDTFCALAALRLHDSSLVDEAVLAQTIKLLLAAETAVGGPYRTWIVSADSEPVWLDVDLAVNANVAFFLSLIGSRLPALDGMMEQAIQEGTFTSPYYPTAYAFLYYLSRAYDGPRRTKLLSLVREHQERAATALDLALCVTARLRLGDNEAGDVVQRLLKQQRRDGAWPAAAFYADPVKQGKRYYNGGPELTTAFVLEALSLYEQVSKRLSEPQLAGRDADRNIRQTVLSAARRQCRTLQPELRRPMSRSLARIARSPEGAEITGLALACYRSLAQPVPLPRTFLVDLGAANLYGWLAYTIYDDFLDDEGRPELLPTANAAMRRSFRSFMDALPDTASFHTTVSETFDAIDAANTWELAHCRFRRSADRIRIRQLPDYGDLSKLAERSLGHTLGPLAVLVAQGAGTREINHCRQALRQYLIVRQLHDDLHDWQEDLGNGHITAVIARLLRHARLGQGTYAVADLTDRLKRPFWRNVLPAVCQDMTRRIAIARRELDRAGVFVSDNALSGLLDGMEASVRDTLAKQRQATAFLGHYKGRQAKKT